ncbi:MAG: helix-turn-helix domain-containing protein [Lachnospiraceae bacterium]|nr:helix-turn-helix domain-containing protein [Lachnospiraceae bacterium]
MKLSSVWLYEQILKKYRMIGHEGLSGRDSYLRPYLCLDADYNKRPGHVCVVPVTAEREAKDIANAALTDKTFLVFCLRETVKDNSEAENHSADHFTWTAEENRPGGAYVCIAANDAAAVLNDIQAVFDLCDEWEDSIISLLAGDAGMEKVLEVSAGFLGNPLMVMGTDFSLIADADMEKLPERARLFAEDGVNVEYMNALLQDAAYQKIAQAEHTELYPGYISGYRTVNRNLFVNGRPTHRLVLTECDNPVTPGCICILETLAGHLEYQLSREMPASMKGTLEIIFQSILTDRTADYVQIGRQLNAAGWGSGDEYLCLILQITYLNQKQLSTGAICRYIQKQFRDSVSFLYRDEVVSFFNLTRLGMDEEEAAAKLVYFIRDSYLKAGYSRTMRGHMNLRRQYVQARVALDVGSRKKPYLWIHYFDQVALPYIIEQATKRLPANMICHKGLLRLKEQDEKNHTEYMLTLKTYLDQHLNATQTAKELFIHRSTFLYRLDKIKEIVHSDLEDAEEVFYLELSFRLLEQDEKKD